MKSDPASIISFNESEQLKGEHELELLEKNNQIKSLKDDLKRQEQENQLLVRDKNELQDYVELLERALEQANVKVEELQKEIDGNKVELEKQLSAVNEADEEEYDSED